MYVGCIVYVGDSGAGTGEVGLRGGQHPHRGDEHRARGQLQVLSVQADDCTDRFQKQVKYVFKCTSPQEGFLTTKFRHIRNCKP